MLYQHPWLCVHVLEHGDPLKAFINQSASAIDFNDIAYGWGGNPCFCDGARNSRFIVSPIWRAPITIEFEDMAIIPYKDLSGPYLSNRCRTYKVSFHEMLFISYFV